MRSLFSKATLPGWVLLVISQSKFLYNLVDAWSNLEFITEKVRGVRLLAFVADAVASPWFQVSLILGGLAWIALASPQARDWLHLLWFMPRRRKVSGETEEEVVYLISRPRTEQLADRRRERKGEKFRLVQEDQSIREYSRQEIDGLTSTQRQKLFAADSEMKAWWRGKSPTSGAWPLFRAKGGIWIDKHQVAQTPRENDLDIFQGIPDLLDWFMKDSKF